MASKELEASVSGGTSNETVILHPVRRRRSGEHRSKTLKHIHRSKTLTLTHSTVGNRKHVIQVH